MTTKPRFSNSRKSSSLMNERQLSGDEAYESPYFEDYDIDGDSYSLAWRYLGVYIDADDSYSRKVLWAAYYYPNYSGNQIGEYSFYDADSASWDNSTCVSDDCPKMDCHLSSSSTWTIVGVYKESLDFDNDAFFEQLFKHQGVCLWGGDDTSTYQFMQNMRKNWQGSCSYARNGYYIGTKPLEDGDVTYAVYGDARCKRESNYDLDRFLSDQYDWDEVFEKWNDYMGVYKQCQPCRAYSLTENYQDSWSDSPSNDEKGGEGNKRRNLIEYNDGEGDEEVNGYNCYDDAGYRNCNQCFKFDTHSDMEEASADDLKLASSQGTILEVTIDGVTYGGGTNSSNADYYEVSSLGVVAVAMMLLAAFSRVTRTVAKADLKQPLAQH